MEKGKYIIKIRYINIIKEQINNHADSISGPDYIFQQDNASVHTSRLIQSYFNENNISILPWSARSLVFNIIENCWAELVHGVYANGKQYQHVQELKNVWRHSTATSVGRRQRSV